MQTGAPRGSRLLTTRCGLARYAGWSPFTLVIALVGVHAVTVVTLLVLALDCAVAATIAEFAATEALAVAAVVDAVVALLFTGLNHCVAAAWPDLAERSALAVAAVVDAVVTLLAEIFLHFLVAAACAESTIVG